MPGPGRKPAIDATLRMPPAALQAVEEREREIGQRAHVEVDHRKLLGAIEAAGGADQAEAGIVDDGVRLEIGGRRARRRFLRGIRAREIRAQNRRPGPAARCNGIGHHVERLLAPGNENEVMTVGGKVAQAPPRCPPTRR